MFICCCSPCKWSVWSSLYVRCFYATEVIPAPDVRLCSRLIRFCAAGSLCMFTHRHRAAKLLWCASWKPCRRRPNHWRRLVDVRVALVALGVSPSMVFRCICWACCGWWLDLCFFFFSLKRGFVHYVDQPARRTLSSFMCWIKRKEWICWCHVQGARFCFLAMRKKVF